MYKYGFLKFWLVVFLMVFNATFNNIVVVSWRSVLLVNESGGPEKTINLSQVTDKLYHKMLYTSSWSRFKLITSVAIGTDWRGSCKSNYHTITTMTTPCLSTRWTSIFVTYPRRSVFTIVRQTPFFRGRLLSHASANSSYF